MFRLLAAALFNIIAASGDGPLQAVAVRAADALQVVIILGRSPLNDEIT
jgi:hypothetical protein